MPDTAVLYDLTSEWTRRHMAIAVPGAYWDAERKSWCVADPSPRTAAIILRMFPELAVQHPELAATRDKLMQDVRPFDNATLAGLRVSDRATEIGTGVARALNDRDQWWYDFQDLDLGYLKGVLEKHGGAYIGWERGLGKTLGACSLIDALSAQRTLVVCPNTAKAPVWGAELRRWLPNHDVMVLPNQKNKREDMLMKVDALIQGQTTFKPFVLVVHYEALALIAGKRQPKGSKSPRIGDGWQRLGEWDLVVADEAHRVWNTKAQMTRALKKVPSRMRLALSGSVIQNHPEELFSVLQWLFPDTYRAKWRDWNDRYLDYAEDGYGRTCIGVRPDAIKPMRKELGVFMVYRRKTDELDLPPRVEQTMLVDLAPKQRKAYNELRDQYWTELDDGTTVVAAGVLAQLTKLRQVATGLDLLGREVADSTKLDVTEELIRDNPDEAFVVFSWFKAPCASLAERLERAGIGCHVVDGDVPHQERSDRIEAFMGGEGQVFIGTLATLGESVNLQRASNAIFLDRHWNPATNVQAADRIYRIGQDKPVTITHLVAKDTVDELRVLPTLANKEAVRRAIFGGE